MLAWIAEKLGVPQHGPAAEARYGSHVRSAFQFAWLGGEQRAVGDCHLSDLTRARCLDFRRKPPGDDAGLCRGAGCPSPHAVR